MKTLNKTTTFSYEEWKAIANTIDQHRLSESTALVLEHIDDLISRGHEVVFKLSPEDIE